MDTITVILEGLRVILGFLMLLFVPGFALSLVIFPRFNSIGIVERLAYSAVLSIGSVIALVLFMDVVLGINTKPENIVIVIAIFSYFAFFLWLCMLWYQKSRLKQRLEPEISADYHKVQSFYTREINAARDHFRQDTRTSVIYHEDQPSGLNLVDHSYLLDVGEEIDIQQVVENKVKVTESALIPPPYPKTQYYELVIREYREDGLSLVDDLQIYPVIVLKKPDKKLLRFVLQRGTTHISERIHTKTSTTEVEWIYSHDFHLFAIIHTEDTINQMVDRIIGKLDEIALSLKNGVHISSYSEDRQILQDAFNAVMIEKPRVTPVKPLQIAQHPEAQFSAELWEIPKREEDLTRIEPNEIQKRPVILADVESKGVPKPPEVPAGEVLIEIPKRPVIQTGPEPKEIPKPPEGLTEEPAPKLVPKLPVIQAGPESKDIPKPSDVLTQESGPIVIHTRHIIQTRSGPQEVPPSPAVQSGDVPKKIPQTPVIQTGPEHKEISQPPVIETGAETKKIIKPPEVQTSVALKEIPEPSDVRKEFELKEFQKHPSTPAGSGPAQIPRPPEIQSGVEPKEIFTPAPEQHTIERKEIPQPLNDQYRVDQQEILKHQKARIGTPPKEVDRRKLQKGILQDLDVFGITPDSFAQSKKYIENIQIPKKSDLPQKLAKIAEDKDIDWLDLTWLYEEEK